MTWSANPDALRESVAVVAEVQERGDAVDPGNFR